MIDHLSSRFTDLYNPHKEVAVEEAMIKFTGHSILKQYMLLKPVKRGVKVWPWLTVTMGTFTSSKSKEGSGKKHLGQSRLKSRKFYKYIFFFLFDVAVTNAYILLKSSGSYTFKDFKSFRLHLGKDLIGEYCSRQHRGHGGTIIYILPFRHYPMKLNGDGSRHPRGLHHDIHKRQVLST